MDDRRTDLMSMASPDELSSTTAPGRSVGHTALRTDIQALRALAVGLVVVYHIWPDAVPGGYVGVDVFFVISGFLITTHLVKHPPQSRHDLAAFWARRIGRLLPASLVTLAVTLIGVRLLAPEGVWANTWRDGLAATLYVANWRFADQAVDYLAADTASSALQHFWSLSVEEQFYGAWPLVVLVVAIASGQRLMSNLRIVLLAAVAVSFLWSVSLTGSEPGRAYFVTTTRIWELGIGCLLAVWLNPRRRLPDRIAPIAATVGVVLIVVSGLSYSSSTAFPGSAAALPVLATALVIAADSDRSPAMSRLWRVPGVQWLGAMSYSLYLWHWPVLVLAGYALRGEPTGVGKVVVLGIALAVSPVSKIHIEDRFRSLSVRMPSWRTLAAGLCGMAVLTAGCTVLIRETAARAERSEKELQAALGSPSPCFGAAAVLKGEDECPPSTNGTLVPDLSIAADDLSDAYADNCFVGYPYSGRKVCTFGTGPTRVALVGNSHAGHWLPALQAIADIEGWTISTYLISVCNATDATLAFTTAEERANCRDWGRWVEQELTTQDFDIVVRSERQSQGLVDTTWQDTESVATEGYLTYHRRLVDAGVRVVVLRDPVPTSPEVGSVPDCLGRVDEWDGCTWSATPDAPASPNEYRWSDPLTAAADSLGLPTVGVEDVLCPEGRCRAVIGGVVTLRDTNHFTATFARTLAPSMRDQLRDALDR